MESMVVVEQSNKEVKLLLLPPEILLDILSRLPAVSVVRCELVCRTLRSLIVLNKHNPHFARAHLHHQQQLHDASNYYDFITFNDQRDGHDDEDGNKKYNFRYAEFAEDYDDDEHISYRVIKMDSPMMMNGNLDHELFYKITGSCNGLVCLEGCEVGPVCVCNPVTREYVYLPRDRDLDGEARSKYISNSGFGYHPGTGEYKVVRIIEPIREEHSARQPGQLQVYTLGKDGDKWRNKGQLDHKINWDPPVLLDGILYWSILLGDILSFDLAEEKFAVVPGPPVDWSTGILIQLGVMGGSLFVIKHEIRMDMLNVWVMKDRKTWVKEFSISSEDALFFAALACTVNTNGEVLFWDRHDDSRYLASYDPKTRKVKVPGQHLKAAKYTWIGAVPHINSFISLKALGEENANIISGGTLMRDCIYNS